MNGAAQINFPRLRYFRGTTECKRSFFCASQRKLMHTTLLLSPLFLALILHCTYRDLLKSTFFPALHVEESRNRSQLAFLLSDYYPSRYDSVSIQHDLKWPLDMNHSCQLQPKPLVDPKTSGDSEIRHCMSLLQTTDVLSFSYLNLLHISLRNFPLTLIKYSIYFSYCYITFFLFFFFFILFWSYLPYFLLQFHCISA